MRGGVRARTLSTRGALACGEVVRECVSEIRDQTLFDTLDTRVSPPPGRTPAQAFRPGRTQHDEWLTCNEKEGTVQLTSHNRHLLLACFVSRRSFNGNRHSCRISVPQALTDLRALSKHRKLQGPHCVRRESPPLAPPLAALSAAGWTRRRQRGGAGSGQIPRPTRWPRETRAASAATQHTTSTCRAVWTTGQRPHERTGRS
jgi:hypothetical protein